MELKEDGALELRGFSPHSLTFLPSVNCFLAVDGIGKSRCLDLASGAELYSTGRTGSTIYGYSWSRVDCSDDVSRGARGVNYTYEM